MRVTRVVHGLALLGLASLGCNGQIPSVPTPTRATTSPGSTSSPAAPSVADDAKLVSFSIPATMYAGEMSAFYVTVANVGTATWDDNFRLGAVGNMSGDATRFLEDPSLGYPDVGRIHLPAGTTVPSKGSYTFAFVGKAPATQQMYDVKLQMIHEGVGWFGPVIEQKVTVGPALAAGTVPPDEVDLSKTKVHNSPSDIASWPATAKITRLQVQAPGGFQIDFTKRDGPGSWPDYTPPGFGGPIEYTLWSVEKINGQWHTSGVIQIWRDPSLTEWSGGMPSGLAQNWYYDPGRWGALSGYQPATGEPVGFMVTAGNARNVTAPGATSVLERSNVVIVPFPSDTGALFKFQ